MKVTHFLVLISVGVLLFLQPVVSYATEGGQVQQEAGVEFYVDESSEPSVSSSEWKNSSSTVAKPTGKFPNTGEIAKKSLVVSGIALVMIVFLFFVLKKRKGREE